MMGSQFVTSRRRLVALLFGAFVTGRPTQAQNPTSLGTLTPFYRGTQLQGHLIGMALVGIPDYLLSPDIDLKYKKNPALRKEIPFVDSFTINRFLGGYREDWLKKYGLLKDDLGDRSLDYVTRDSNGSLVFRPDLIRQRLAPYLEAGYRPKDITIALENIPWDLAGDRKGSHHEGLWGQDQPPKDMSQWSSVISHFAEDLKDYLGPAAGNIGFETGVEYDERGSFDASPDEFYRYYAASDSGLHAVLPDASLTPGEFTGVGVCEPASTACVYDTQAFVAFARAHNLRVGVVPRSLHSVFSSPQASPSSAVRRAESSYARIPDATPEVHQFGLLGQPVKGVGGSDPAAAQSNWQFQTLIGLWQRVKPRRVFHWGGMNVVGNLQFLNGTGFLRLVLDRYAGTQATLLAVEAANKTAVPPNTERMAVVLSSPTASAVIISSFSAATGITGGEVRIHVPRNLFKASAGELKVLRYRESDNVFTAVRADLAAENNLKAEFAGNPTCVSDPMSMANEPGALRRMLAKNWRQYMTIMQRDLKFRANDSDIRFDDSSTLRATLEGNELLVVEKASNRL